MLVLVVAAVVRCFGLIDAVLPTTQSAFSLHRRSVICELSVSKSRMLSFCGCAFWSCLLADAVSQLTRGND